MSKKGHTESVGHSAPLWFISWADMCTLMLGLFVIMYSFSDTDGAKYKFMSEAVMATFGFSPSVPPVSLEVTPLERLKAEAMRRFKDSLGDSTDDGVDGRHMAVRTIRNGLQFTLGGAVSFAEGKAMLQPAVHEDLLKIANTIRGYKYKVEIRGHTSKAVLPKDSPFSDHMDLSYARAKAVSDFLVEQGGIHADCIRLTAAGAFEPVVTPAYDPPKWAKNSRVEIIVTESLVQEYQGDGKDNSLSAPVENSESEGAKHGG